MQWKYGIFVLVVVAVLAELHGRHSVQQRWDIAKAGWEQKIQDALKQRQSENEALVACQTIINNQIQKTHDEEINTVRHALANSECMRIGPQFCPDITGQTTTQSASSGDASDTASRVLSEQMDSAVKQLISESEQVAATGRAAQAFLRENGLAD